MGRRKKNRTHVEPVQNDDPKSFVIKAGELTSVQQQLVRDYRRTFEPNTASRLRERKGNRVKDFVAVAGQLGVSHLAVFSQGKTGINLRLGRFPRGPTFSFHVKEYALMKDVLRLQSKPKSPGIEFQHPPLVVLNNFPNPKHMNLMTTYLQNMYPTIKVNTMSVNEAKRVILYHYNDETKLIEFRHYLVTVKHIGISKSVKSIIQTKVPKLGQFEDIGDFVLRGAFASESDVEDAQDTVEIQRKNVEQRAVKLVEVGPRMSLELIKVEAGLLQGEVLHHTYQSKTEEQVQELKEKKHKQLEEKKRRREEQEERVRLKKKPKAELEIDEISSEEEDAVDPLDELAMDAAVEESDSEHE
ncbi:Brix domain-containing protein [Gorgonomyces haynaldii]|nr:Brix domain-containing protein [Gorgonomyces haynaldii]